MALGALESSGPPSSAGTIFADTLNANGSAHHPYACSPLLRKGADAARNLADMVHCLCMLHGQAPGIVDLALPRAEGAAADMLAAAAPAFAAERAWIAELLAASGPLPSTPGQAESEAALVGQSRALEMLGESERQGCAAGAALALLADWHAIHAVLDIAAERFGIDPQPIALPSIAAIRAVAEATGGKPAHERALNFGAQQLLLQHRGLWDLLEARESARRETS